MRGDVKQQQEPPTQKASKITKQARVGIIGSLYPHLVKGNGTRRWRWTPTTR